MKTFALTRVVLLAAAIVIVTAASTRLNADTSTCGGASISLPFTDVASTNIFFCSIGEAFFSGLANGTTATTYNPGDPVPREQMAAFVSRTMDQSVKRASKRAALDQFWTTQTESNLGLTAVGGGPRQVKSDGVDLWVANFGASGTVSRVRASDGKKLEEWTDAFFPFAVVAARGKVIITGAADPGRLYQIDPTQAPGAVTTLSSSLGPNPVGIAYDGERFWTANNGGAGTGSVSIVTLNPVNVTTVTAGFASPNGVIYDGANIWVTDYGDNTLKKLDSNGGILMSVAVGVHPFYPVFDGTNIWVPNRESNSVTVVRGTGSLAGTVIATLMDNGLNGPQQPAFDGERVLVANLYGNSVSLWKASDLSPIGTFSIGSGGNPYGACSDGLNFWIALQGTNKLARF